MMSLKILIIVLSNTNQLKNKWINQLKLLPIKYCSKLTSVTRRFSTSIGIFLSHRANINKKLNQNNLILKYISKQAWKAPFSCVYDREIGVPAHNHNSTHKYMSIKLSNTTLPNLRTLHITFGKKKHRKENIVCRTFCTIIDKLYAWIKLIWLMFPTIGRNQVIWLMFRTWF